MNKTINPVSLAFFLLATFITAHLYATDYTFNACSGNWSDPSNWSPNGVPGAFDNVTIYIGCGSGVVTLTENTIVNNLSITGSSTLTGSFDLTVNGNLTFAAQLSTVGNVTVAGTMTWSGGLLGSSASTTGTITVSGLMTIQGAGGSLYKKNLTANGGINHTAGSIGMALGSTLTIPTGQVYQNSTPTGAYFINFGSGGVINMQGTFQRTVSGSFEFKQGITFNNSGTVQLSAGTLDFNEGGTHTGLFSVGNGTILSFGTGTHNMNGATFSGTGEIKQTGGTINLNSGTGIFEQFNMSSGTFNSSVNVTVMNNMTITGSSTLTGSFNLTVNGNLTFRAALHTIGDVTVNGALTWNGGSLGLNATTTGTITVSGLVTLQTDARALHKKTLTANGGINHIGYDTYMTSGAVINVPAGQTYQSSTPDGAKITNLGGGGMINIYGTFHRTVTGGFTFGSSIDVNNSGTVRVDAGSVTFSGTFNNSGVINGAGTINFDGTFIQSGTISPGNSPGILTLSRLPSGTTTTYIEMQGSTTPGIDYDKITVNGTGVISGILNISFLNGYEPTVGSEFIIMTCTNCSGSFSNIIHPGTNPNAWQVSIVNSNQVKLVLAQSLPIELTSFTAKSLSETTAHLQWETASELNNYGFYIEKSTDGQDFQEISFVNGAGNSQETISYMYLDDDFRQDAYYRLRQMDYDGKISYSNIVHLEHEGNSLARIQISPNPTSDKLIVSLNSENILPIHLTIVNSSGQVLIATDIEPQSVQVEIDISQLTAGIYFLKEQSGAVIQFVKF